MMVIVKVPRKRPSEVVRKKPQKVPTKNQPQVILGDRDLDAFTIRSSTPPLRTSQSWGTEIDDKLWNLIQEFGGSSPDWSAISSRIGLPIKECIQRSGELYRKQLEFLNRDLHLHSSEEMGTPTEEPATPKIQSFQEKLKESVAKHHFDWNAIGKDLHMEPNFARETYMNCSGCQLEEDHMDPDFLGMESSVTMSELVNVLNSQNFTTSKKE